MQQEYKVPLELEEKLRYELHQELDSDIVNYMNPQRVVEYFEEGAYEQMQVL